MENRDGRGRVWVCVVGIALTSLPILGQISCRGVGHYEPAPTPSAGFSNPDSASRGTILSYARSLAYDTNAGAGDEQRLMIGTTCPPWAGGGNCTYGPLARIEPEIGSYRIQDTTDLGAGRIIARVIAVDSQYPKLGLRGGDTTYWWVDRKGPTGWRSVLVPSDTVSSLVHRDTLVLHPAASIAGHAYQWRQSVARFYWHDSDDTLWGTCTPGYCCKM